MKKNAVVAIGRDSNNRKTKARKRMPMRSMNKTFHGSAAFGCSRYTLAPQFSQANLKGPDAKNDFKLLSWCLHMI